MLEAPGPRRSHKRRYSNPLYNWQLHNQRFAMAMRVSHSKALASALRSSRAAVARRNDCSTAIRAFSSTQNTQVVVSSETPNMRHAQRASDPPGGLQAPIVNPVDKYAAKADDMHRYGSWLMGCLPKYIQQFSVWKDELVIYIAPSGVIPVFSFLKCRCYYVWSGHFKTDT